MITRIVCMQCHCFSIDIWGGFSQSNVSIDMVYYNMYILKMAQKFRNASNGSLHHTEQNSKSRQIHKMLGSQDISLPLSIIFKRSKFSSYAVAYIPRLIFDLMNIIDRQHLRYGKYLFMVPCITWSNLRPFSFKSELFENLTPCTKVHWPFSNCPIWYLENRASYELAWTTTKPGH